MKKTIFLMLLFYFMIPSFKANAAIIDLISGSEAEDLTNGVTTKLITDGDLNTGYETGMLGDYVLYIPFNSSVSRDSVISYEASYAYIGTGSNTYISFVDNKNNEFGHYNLLRNSTISIPSNLSTTVKGVKVYIVVNSIRNKFSDLKIFYDDALNTNVPIVYDAISNLTESNTTSEVDLQWVNPTNPEHVSTLVKRNGLQIAEVQSNEDKYSVTNLQSDTSYVFDLVAKYSDGGLSLPTTITVQTQKKPVLPAMAGATYEKLANGDYELKWVDPTTGNVVVDVGGSQFAIVPAANGTLIIPAASMQYTALGAPNIEMTPEENGLTGRKVRPQRLGGVGAITGFSVFELILATFGLIGMLGWIVLISIALDLVPGLISVLQRNGGAVRR